MVSLSKVAEVVILQACFGKNLVRVHVFCDFSEIFKKNYGVLS